MKKILYIALILGIASCGKIDHNEQNLNKSEVVNIGISTEIATRATTPVSNNFEIGLFLCEADMTPHTIPENANIRAKYITPSGWGYYYQSSSDKLSQISLNKKSGGKLDCYTYSPYNVHTTDIQKIPFTTTDQQDLMRAVGGADNELSNKNIILTGESLTIPLKFKRVMSLLIFKLKLKNSQNSVRLNKIRFWQKVEANICISGTLDATTGILTKCLNDSLSITTSGTIPFDGTTPLVKEIIFVPTEILTDGIDIYLTINNKELTKPITISNINIEAGHSYKLDITIDNYAKLTGITVDETWLSNGESIEI